MTVRDNIDYLPVLQNNPNDEMNHPNVYLLFDDSGDFMNPAIGGISYAWHLYNCLNGLVTGQFAEGLKQYGAGKGVYAGYQFVHFPDAMNTESLEAFIDETVKTSLLNDLYFCFIRPYALVGDDNFQYGKQFCAYHSVSPNNTAYAAIPFPTVAGCSLFGQLSNLDAMCMTSSHELAEAMTDRTPGQGTVTNEGEIDDFAPCLWVPVSFTFNGWNYKIQGYWDELNKNCWTPDSQIDEPPMK